MSESEGDVVAEEIWNNWKSRDGPCSECTVYDESGCARPYYADGALDADVAFVAMTPGDTRETCHGEQSCWDEIPETHAERRETWDPVEDFLPGSRISTKFFDKHLGDDFGFSAEAQHPIYFTNAKKCADVEGGEDWWNGQGYEQCRAFLPKELEAVGPTVVVTLGQKPTKHLHRAYGLTEDLPGQTSIALKSRTVGPWTVIPSLHWSFAGTHLDSVDGIGSMDEYWRTLAESIRRHIQVE